MALDLPQRPFGFAAMRKTDEVYTAVSWQDLDTHFSSIDRSPNTEGMLLPPYLEAAKVAIETACGVESMRGLRDPALFEAQKANSERLKLFMEVFGTNVKAVTVFKETQAIIDRARQSNILPSAIKEKYISTLSSSNRLI